MCPQGQVLKGHSSCISSPTIGRTDCAGNHAGKAQKSSKDVQNRVLCAQFFSAVLPLYQPCYRRFFLRDFFAALFTERLCFFCTDPCSLSSARGTRKATFPTSAVGLKKTALQGAFTCKALLSAATIYGRLPRTLDTLWLVPHVSS